MRTVSMDNTDDLEDWCFATSTRLAHTRLELGSYWTYSGDDWSRSQDCIHRKQITRMGARSLCHSCSYIKQGPVCSWFQAQEATPSQHAPSGREEGC